VVPIKIDGTQVAEEIREFGAVVDAIEGKQFGPPGVTRLRQRDSGNKTFGSRVCRSCDAWFSCSSYRKFAKAPRRRNAVAFLPFYESLASEEERQAWWESAFPGSRRPEEIAEDLR
jgi:hypothetical protein